MRVEALAEESYAWALKTKGENVLKAQARAWRAERAETTRRGCQECIIRGN